ncbi:MAG: histidinol dehydrogenase [Hydrogenophilaceae bacterium]|jgi:histidinol dehydrogenase|nr:histidinol dehydrogenase [Hydrogenophilaceae bacterium]
MKRFDWAALSRDERAAALARPARRREARVSEAVAAIFADVEREGFAAVARWAEKLDRRAPEAITLSARTVDAARAQVSREDLVALDVSVENVTRYHAATKPAAQRIEVRPGVVCTRVWRPIETCGLYVPGGTAPLFSTLIMLAAPAGAAGVKNRIAATPPNAQGGAEAAAHPMMIAAAAACGLDSLWLLGGAQAVAAMTYGAGMARADKIFGPGNAYVAEAKRYAAALPGGPAIDAPCGPSELMVVADDSADPALVAADLLSQAEHDEDAQVLFAAFSEDFIDAVTAEVGRQVAALPRAAIARAALSEARAFRVRSVDEAAAVANAYAPEHLSVQITEPARIVPLIDNAGAVFVGASSGETFGDYVCGPSHALPTDGAARAWSGVSVASFMKSFTVQELSAEGARSLADAAGRLARLEGLEAHARAADMRAVR